MGLGDLDFSAVHETVASGKGSTWYRYIAMLVAGFLFSRSRKTPCDLWGYLEPEKFDSHYVITTMACMIYHLPELPLLLDGGNIWEMLRYITRNSWNRCTYLNFICEFPAVEKISCCLRICTWPLLGLYLHIPRCNSCSLSNLTGASPEICVGYLDNQLVVEQFKEFWWNKMIDDKTNFPHELRERERASLS